MTTSAKPEAGANLTPPPPTGDQITSLVATYIDKRWESHYEKAWERLGGLDGLKKGGYWNWTAAFFPVEWLAYRRQWKIAVGVFGAFLVIGALPRMASLGWLAIFIGFGYYGDRIILRGAWESASAALQTDGPGPIANAKVKAAGGVSVAALVLSIILPAVISSGAAMLLSRPKAPTVNLAYRTVMRSDLKKLLAAEEAYRATNSTYTKDLVALGFTQTRGLLPPKILLSDSGFSATVTLPQQTDLICGIAVRAPNPVSETAIEGETFCK